MLKKEWIGQLGLLVVAIIWGTSFTVSVYALETYTPLQVIGLRYIISCIGMLALNIFRIHKIQPSTWKKGLFLGTLLFWVFALMNLGLKYTTASNNAFLSGSNIIFLPFIAWALNKQAPSLRTLLGVMVTFIGIGFMSLSHSGEQWNIGDLYTILSAGIFAFYLHFSEAIAADVPSWALTTVQMLVASVWSIVVLGSIGELNVALTVNGAFSISYLAVVCTLLCFYLQAHFQPYTTSTKAGLILSLESVFGMLGSVIFLGEKPTLIVILGSILIMLGIVIVQLEPSDQLLVLELDEEAI